MIPAPPWDDRTKFIADTTRTVVLATLGTIAVILAVKPWEATVAYRAEVEKARLTVSAKVVDDFLAVAYLYTAIAFDACKGEAAPRSKFQGESFDQYRAAENRLSVYFSGNKKVQDQVKVVQETTGALFQLCKAGESKEVWEPKRQALKAANNALAAEALASLGFRAE